MAQWTGQFSGFKHEAKVQDIEDSLRRAITTFQDLPEAKRSGEIKAIRHLAERLLAICLKALPARMLDLTGPGSKLKRVACVVAGDMGASMGKTGLNKFQLGVPPRESSSQYSRPLIAAAEKTFS